MTTQFIRFVVKRDTAAAFTAANTLLLQGEWALETDTGLMKMGDGVTAWTALAYFSTGGGAAGTQVLAVASGDFTLSAGTHLNKLLLYAGGVITLPATVAAGFAVNDVVEVRWQSGAGVDFLADTGVTLDFNDTLYSASMNALKDVVALKVIAVDAWALLGPLADA